MGEDARLRGRVVLHRVVPVDVVLRHVEQHRDIGHERVGRELELERRHLGDDDVGFVFGGVDDGAPDVADRSAAQAGLLADRRDHRGDGRLAVGAGDRDEARRRRAGAQPLDGDVDLGPHRHARHRRGDDRGMIGTHARARDHEIDRRRAGGDERRVGCLEQLRAGDHRAPRPLAVRVAAGLVFEHDDVVVGGDRPRNRGVAGGTESDHEDAHQSIAPGMLMKSA